MQTIETHYDFFSNCAVSGTPERTTPVSNEAMQPGGLVAFVTATRLLLTAVCVLGSYEVGVVCELGMISVVLKRRMKSCVVQASTFYFHSRSITECLHCVQSCNIVNFADVISYLFVFYLSS